MFDYGFTNESITISQQFPLEVFLLKKDLLPSVCSHVHSNNPLLMNRKTLLCKHYLQDYCEEHTWIHSFASLQRRGNIETHSPAYGRSGQAPAD